MADEGKAQKPKAYFDRLLEHVRSKNFANGAEIESALHEFKDMNANRPKYYEKVEGEADPKVVPFGKYKGKRIAELMDTDRQYLEWLVKQKWMDRFPAMRAEILAEGFKAGAGKVEKPLTPQELEIARLQAELAKLK